MEDSRRSTGRTTRMLLKAALAAGDERTVIITAYSERYAYELRNRFISLIELLGWDFKPTDIGVDVLGTRYAFKTHTWVEDYRNTRGLIYIVFQDHYRP